MLPETTCEKHQTPRCLPLTYELLSPIHLPGWLLSDLAGAAVRHEASLRVWATRQAILRAWFTDDILAAFNSMPTRKKLEDRDGMRIMENGEVITFASTDAWSLYHDWLGAWDYEADQRTPRERLEDYFKAQEKS